MTHDIKKEHIDAVRAFNRFFLSQTGVLSEGILHTNLSLTEARIVVEVGQQDELTARDLCHLLNLDPGYLSRTLKSLEQQGLIRRIRSHVDGRQRLLSLTDEGLAAFSLIDRGAQEEISERLSQLDAMERSRLVEAMHAIQDLLGQED